MPARARSQVFPVNALLLSLGVVAAAACGTKGSESAGDAGEPLVDAGPAPVMDGGPVEVPDAGPDAGPPLDMDAGPKPVGSASVVGTIGGESLAALDAQALVGSDKIVIADVAGLCTRLGDSMKPKNSHELTFTLQQSDATGAPTTLTPGAYSIGPSAASMRTAGAEFNGYTAECAADISTAATSGTVTLTSVSSGNGEIVGMFNLMFGTDHVTGSFTAPDCSPMLTTPSCR